jgi:hypothetical protein
MITIIIVLSLVLLILIMLNNVSIEKSQSSDESSCTQTMYGCCPDGVNSKINFYGTNCPGPRKPIGGCAGTRYGCCPDKRTPKIDINGGNCLKI